MAILATLSSLRKQAPGFSWLPPVLAYVDECLTKGSPPNIKLFSEQVGETYKRELAGGAFGLEQTYLTKAAAEGKFETHRKYIDVQVIAEGDEYMQIGDREAFRVSEDYIPERDVVFYHPEVAVTSVRMPTGMVAIYFPTDVHRGGIQIQEPSLVRKIVVKVPVV